MIMERISEGQIQRIESNSDESRFNPFKSISAAPPFSVCRKASKIPHLIAAITLGLLGVIGEANASDKIWASWSFDDCTATDTSGNGRNGEVHGSACLTALNAGKFLQFNNSNNQGWFDKKDWVTLPNFSGSSLIFKAKVKWQKADNYDATAAIWSIGDNSSPNFLALFTNANLGKLWVNHGNSNTPEADISDGSWHDIEVVTNTATSILYLDGRSIGSAPKLSRLNFDNAPHYLSMHQWYYGDKSSSRFYGEIDSVSILIDETNNTNKHTLAAVVPITKNESKKTASNPNTGAWLADADTVCRVWNNYPASGESIKWSGGCSNNMATGKGKLQWYLNGKPNGSSEGSFIEGKLQGTGIEIWSNGDRYEGDFVDSLKQGFGVLTRLDGKVDSGIWRAGNFVRSCLPRDVCEAEEAKREAEEAKREAEYLAADEKRKAEYLAADEKRKAEYLAADEKRKADVIAADTPKWNKAKTINTLAGYRDYIRKNPGSYFLNDAFVALYAKVQASGNVNAYSEFIDEFSDAPSAEQAKTDKLKASKLTHRFSFREGKIGQRYVPSYSNTYYSSENYTVNGKIYTETRSNESSSGGYQEGRYGFTAVYQLFNESRQPYVVRIRISCTSTMSENHVQSSAWTGNKSLASRTNENYLSKEMYYLLDANRDVKDQLVVGESRPSDFKMEITEVYPVSAGWIAGLRKALDSKGDLRLINTYLADPKATGWHENLANVFSKTARKQVGVKIATSKRFDPDFESPVTFTISNRSGMGLHVSYKPNFASDDTLDLSNGQSKTITLTSKGVAKNELAVELQTLTSLSGSQAIEDKSTQYAAGVKERQRITAERANAEARIEQDRAVEKSRIELERAAEKNRIELERKLLKNEQRNANLNATLQPLGYKTGSAFTDCSGCPEMMPIPTGEFSMGSSYGESEETPAHQATVATFALGKTEVTQGQWKAVMGSNPSHFSECGDNCPVESISWNDAQKFIRQLNIITGKQYRLPTEAEWEYACQAGEQHRFCGSDDIASVAWYINNSGNKTHPVGLKQANGFGLFDMSGNVLEWVEDCWHGDYIGAPANGGAWTSSCNGDKRGLRGGSLGNDASGNRATKRDRDFTAKQDKYSGFRLARTITP